MAALVEVSVVEKSFCVLSNQCVFVALAQGLEPMKEVSEAV